MKKFLSIILGFALAFALFSCDKKPPTTDPNGPTSDPIAQIAELYKAFAPSKVVTQSQLTFGDYTLVYDSTLLVGTVDGVKAAVRDFTVPVIHDIEDGAGVEITGPISYEEHKWEYHDQNGRREDGGAWDATGEDFSPEAGAIALNITSETVTDVVADEKEKTVSFNVLADNTEAVFGTEIPADVSVVITHSGADVTGVSINFTVVNEDNDDNPEIVVAIIAEYSYEAQKITLD